MDMTTLPCPSGSTVRPTQPLPFGFFDDPDFLGNNRVRGKRVVPVRPACLFVGFTWLAVRFGKHLVLKERRLFVRRGSWSLLSVTADCWHSQCSMNTMGVPGLITMRVRAQTAPLRPTWLLLHALE